MPDAISFPSGPASLNGGSDVTSVVRHVRSRDLDEARRTVTETYLAHQLWTSVGSTLDMELASARFGDVTAGLLSYGSPVHLSTGDLVNFHVNVTLTGRAASRSGHGESLITRGGHAVVFRPGEPAHVTWSADCRQLCLMAQRAKVETELERLLGYALPRPLVFEASLRAEVRRVWQPAVELVCQQLHGAAVPTQSFGRHLEGILIDALLLTQPHNYHDVVTRDDRAGPPGAIAKAVALLEEFPAEPWTVVGLAQEVDLSVRALQYGFRREFELSPMAYLRKVRLHHAHATLAAASPASTTVRTVALDCGFMHLSRFAKSYRETFGESPSATLDGGDQ